MTDIEVINLMICNIAVKDMTTTTFLGWVAGKINGQETNSPTLSELGMMIAHPPMGKLSVETKLEIIRKMEKLGIKIE